MKKMILALPLLMIQGACSHKTVNDGGTVSPETVTVEREVRPAGGVLPGVVLKATAFRMSGDYSNNVAIGVDEKGNLTYYPAPTDISEASAPVDLGNGWWLNRQGLGKGYKFTDYTFSVYSGLKEVPSKDELLRSVIPGAVVTEIRVLDIPAAEAMSRLEEIKRML